MRQRQTGVVRTNCIDCLDRTNVAKMMVCQKAFNDLVWQDFSNGMHENLMGSGEDAASKMQELKKEADQAMIFMWAYAGDIISKIYSGTPSVLTAVTLKGHEDLSDKFTHYKTSAERWKLQKFDDEFKHECIQILRGQHPSSVHELNNLQSMVMLNQIAQTGQKASLETCLLQISTINCHWRLPTSFNNLDKLFVNN